MISHFQLEATVQISSAKKFATAEVYDQVDESFSISLQTFYGFCVVEATQKNGADINLINEIKIVASSIAYKVVLNFSDKHEKVSTATIELNSENVQRFQLFGLMVHMAKKAKDQHGDKFQQLLNVKVMPLTKDDFTQAHF